MRLRKLIRAVPKHALRETAMSKANKIYDVLKRHGISNASEYLAKNGNNAKVGASSAPDVRVRGSIHLMKKEKVSRKAVNEGLANLKYL